MIQHSGILTKVRDFLKYTKEEFSSPELDLSECVLVFGNESTGILNEKLRVPFILS